MTGAETQLGSLLGCGDCVIPMSPDPLNSPPKRTYPSIDLKPASWLTSRCTSTFRNARLSLPKDEARTADGAVSVNSSVLAADQSIRLDNIEESLDRLQETAGKLGRKIHIVLYGRADQTGAETKNATLRTCARNAFTTPGRTRYSRRDA